ncbi:MAG: 5-formyltetrahydrofolate cyclo-ligase [Rhodobacteraceae bacterium]|nr:5-formyltetrahydrofolate cyclo-ligase [Paracoccaceae bacterium]
MKHIAQQKAAARKTAFANRKEAFGQGYDEAANRNLIGHLALFPDAKIISAFMPIRTEVCPIATMTILYQQGKRICVPVIQGKALPLIFQEWTPEVEMVDGPFGAAVPAGGEFLVPDLVIAPLVAFDKKCYRLGYGGGFYDRSFEEIEAQKPVVGVGFAFSAQELPKVPREKTDKQLDAIVSEQGVLLR